MIRLFTRAAAFAVAATLLLGGAQAQQAPARPSPPQGGAGAPTTPPSQSHLTLARELATISGVLRVYDAFLPQFGAQLRRGAVTRPEITKDLDQVLDALKPELEQQKQAIVDTTLRFYTSAFTEAELKELIAFFKTPVGQKYLQNAPRLLDVLAVETQRWSAKTAEFLMTRVRAEMAKRGHQL
jgi:uncharacterized protein